MEINDRLESEWDRNGGFFGQLREGVFDQSACDRCVALFESLNISGEVTLDRRFVSLVWFAPLFVDWQLARYEGGSGDRQKIEDAKSRITDILLEQLGCP